ncbi:hypothetical protein theurythT_11550 [Thalassotalea eurytherma]|uniref:Uncharacterized protein n=1 Tax=Thalassotalea eurytherma TaxID=1144278 RepID=A0ABQ6H0I0_9GAMM|nr:hypothetical protein theurythT_11550 [Thalassotalea eurytherma]
MSLIILLVCSIIIICIEESKRKSPQPIAQRLKLATLQIVFTVVMILVILYFFSEIIGASTQQIEIIGAIACMISIIVCAYAFRRK